MPADLQPLDLGLPDQTLGLYLPVRVRLGAGGTQVTGFYRLRLAVIPPPNQNPTIAAIELVPEGDAAAAAPVPVDESNPPVVHAGDRLKLRAVPTDGSAEQYPVLSGDPESHNFTTVTETLSVSWFASGGEFSEEITGDTKPDTELKLDKHVPAVGSTIDLYAVMRDPRGGIDWAHRTLLVR
jgi:hypothetical protein